MNISSFQYAGSTIFRHVFYSLLMHTVAVSSLLTLPLYSSGNISEQDNWHFVHLEETETVDVNALSARKSEPDAAKSNSKTMKPAVKQDDLTERIRPKNKQTESSETKKSLQEKSLAKRDAVSKKGAALTVKQQNEASGSRIANSVSQGDTRSDDQGTAINIAEKKTAAPVTTLAIDMPAKTDQDAKASFQEATDISQPADAEDNMRTIIQPHQAGDLLAKKSVADEAKIKRPPAETSVTAAHKAATTERNNMESADILRTLEKSVAAEVMEDKPRVLTPELPSTKKVTLEDPSEATNSNKGPVEKEPYQLSIPDMQEKIAFKTNVPAIKSKINFPAKDTKQERDYFHEKKMLKMQDREKPDIHKIFSAVPVLNKPVLEDIKIVVDLEGHDVPFVSMRFLKKRRAERQQMNDISEEEVECTVDTKMTGLNSSGIRRVFSVVAADNAIYALIINNRGHETYKADIMFRIYEGKEKERKKEYRNVPLEAGAVLQYKFILPYMIFWDDDVFSLEIEDSTYLTKVHKALGLIWKEPKEQKADY